LGVVVPSLSVVRTDVRGPLRTAPDVVFAKVDTEAQHELAAAAQIRSIPTLLAFKKGKLVFNQAGALPPPALDQLIEQIKLFDVDTATAVGTPSDSA
jgi:thioredoxin reductase (NADPH)